MRKKLTVTFLLFVITILGGCSISITNNNFSKKIDCADIYYSYYLDRIKEENEYRKEAGEYHKVNFDLSEMFITKFYYDGDYDNKSEVYSYLLPLGFFYSPTKGTCVLEIESNLSDNDDFLGIRKRYKLWDMLNDTEISYYGIKFSKGSGWITDMGNKSNYEMCVEYLKGNISESSWCDSNYYN